MHLCIDTSSPFASITLVSEKTFRKPIDPHHASEGIIKTIDSLLKEVSATPSDLTGVFVIKGPGSFTGLRVGIAVANQFAHQLNIPIIGMTTDEWYAHMTDEKDFLYLQTMNKAEVYMCDVRCVNYDLNKNHTSKITHQKSSQIIALEELIAKKGKVKWLGNLSEDHLQKLPTTFTEITSLRTPEKTWEHLIENAKLSTTQKYDLVEPYYGKDPMITKSKKKLGL